MIYGMDDYGIVGVLIISIGYGMTLGTLIGGFYRVVSPLIRSKGRERKEIKFIK